MSSTGSLPPSSGLYGAQRNQGQTEANVDLNLQGRDARGGKGNEADPRQGERFGRALKQAMAPSKPKQKDPVEVMTPHMSSLMQPQVALNNGDAPAPVDAPQPSAKDSTVTIAQRIDRHIRAAEQQATLKQGEPMIVKLPANVMGLSQMTMTLHGDVLKVSLVMASEIAGQAGVQAQMAQISRQLSQRHSKYSVEISTEDDQNAGLANGEFNPLIPGGKRL